MIDANVQFRCFAAVLREVSEQRTKVYVEPRVAGRPIRSEMSFAMDDMSLLHPTGIMKAKEYCCTYDDDVNVDVE